MTIKKGVILAAGLGTRLFPITKSIPKCMIPVADKPVIDYIIDEALDSGLSEIAIVCNHKEEVLKDYLSDRPNLTFITQTNTYGTAYALKSALDFIKDDDFCLFLGDEILVSTTPCMKQLLSIKSSYPNHCITAIESTSKDLLSQYNVLSIERCELPKVAFIKEIIEKPKDSFPSSYTSIGRYVISIEQIFSFLSSLPNEPKEEIHLTTFFNNLSSLDSFIGYYHQGKRYDVGTFDKWVHTNNEIAKLKKIIY